MGHSPGGLQLQQVLPQYFLHHSFKTAAVQSRNLSSAPNAEYQRACFAIPSGMDNGIWNAVIKS